MADIVLKDRLGELQTYKGVEQVKLNTTGGGVQIFTAGEKEEKTVELDFSAGAMEVTPSEGKLLTKLGIPAPANLIPENIAEGVDIAGIIGTLAASAGGGALVKFGFMKPNGSYVYQQTITHDLGVVPDIFILSVLKRVSSSGGCIPLMWAASKAFIEANNMEVPGMYVWRYNSTTTYFNAVSQALDDTVSGLGVHSATDTTVIAQANGQAYPLLGYTNHLWIAIGGLT